MCVCVSVCVFFCKHILYFVHSQLKLSYYALVCVLCVGVGVRKRLLQVLLYSHAYMYMSLSSHTVVQHVP